MAQFEIEEEASQTREYCAANCAALRAACPDPSLQDRLAQDDNFKLSHYLDFVGPASLAGIMHVDWFANRVALGRNANE